ncbi:MAG TPA: potassium-transporting ATPase subunit KdpA [Coleofasciculaceae cyanobacterium]|jgi:K+-transporting ATPase ATPase A chain
MFSWMYLGLFLAASLLLTILLGRYMAKVFDGQPTLLTPILAPLEKLILRIAGIPNTESQHWTRYAQDLVLFNLVCGVITFLILCFQHLLPLNPLKLAGMEPWQAFNTICSFVTNTNWQSYSGEVSLTNLSQMLGITFMQVVGAVSGVAVCAGFLRGLTNRPLGHFYQDFTKALLYVFLPVMVVGSLFFMSQGVPQTLDQQTVVRTVEGATQKIALGPVASLLTIKQVGTNGGGFFNANSAHPFENPNPLTNFVEIMLELSIPMGLVYMFGLWLKDRKQGWVIWSAMMSMFLVFLWVGHAFEQAGNPILTHLPGTSLSVDQHATALQSGGNMEGKEVRFGILPSMLFTVATTGTSSGAVNNMHDSLTPIAGMVPMADMMLNIIFGGVGVGLMGFLLYGIIAVFLTGLMVGRTPEIFGKKIEKPEIVLASIAILLHPLIILVPTAIAATNDFGLSSLNNAGPHGLSEILYAYTSAAANNGSAFAGLNANTPWYNISIGLVILLGRYISIIALLAIAGSLLAKPKVEPGPGTLRTNTLLYGAVWLGVILIVGALTFVPVLVLGPVAEHLAMLRGKLF